MAKRTVRVGKATRKGRDIRQNRTNYRLNKETGEWEKVTK